MSGELAVQFSAAVTQGTAPLQGVHWDFKDGSSAIGLGPVHVYRAAGAYLVKVTAADAQGLAATDYLLVTVTAPGEKKPLSAQAYVDKPAGESPLAVSFTCLGIDPEGEALTYSWDFGDGAAAATSATASHTYSPGIFEPTCTASAPDGRKAQTSVEVRVTKDSRLPPRIQKAEGAPSLTACVGEAYKYSESGRPMTRGDRPLTFKLGREVAGQTVGAPSGMQVEPQTGEATWTPQGEQVGEQQVSLVVQNAAG